MVRIFPFRLISAPASPDYFHSEMLYLADPDTCGADGFHEQGQAFPALAAGGREKAGILAAGQFLRFSRNMRRWMRSDFTLHPCQPRNEKKRFNGTNMVLTVPGA